MCIQTCPDTLLRVPNRCNKPEYIGHEEEEKTKKKEK
jgi:hypothetical protein